MKEPKQNVVLAAFKPLYNPINVSNLVTYFSIFTFGLSFGVILSFYSRNLSVSLQIFSNQFSVFTSQPPLLPNVTFPKTETIANVTHSGLEEFQNPAKITHNMSDKELLWKASMVPKVEEFPFNREPKVAFLFLTRGPLPLAPLWELFFKGHKGRYSIYVHSDPSFNESYPEGSVFHGRRIPSKKVEWGNVNMIEAERRLLANALLDFSNQYFVLLSEACIPLFNFSTTYSYLINSSKNFVELYDLPGPVGQGRYSPKMSPTIELGQWRKGSQWFQMDRNLALEMISDNTYFPVFQKYCTGSCYADEHYLPTLVNIKFGEKNSNRTLTWTDWSRGGPHPARFLRTYVSVEFLEQLRRSSKCEYNGKKTDVCFLFARKFLPDALSRLMRFAPKVMQFNR